MKKHIKNLTLSLITTSLICTQSSAIFGVGDVVIDPTHIAETAAGWVAEAKRWETDIINTTGIRDVVQFTKDIQQLQQVMDEWKIDLMDLNIDNPQSQIGVMAKQLFDKYTLFDDCTPTYYNEDQRRICKNTMVRSVQEIATYQNYSTQLQTFSNKLKDLSTKLANSKDPKESQDISNAISMQLAQIQVSKTQIMLMQAKNRSVERAEKRQKEQLEKKSSNKILEF